MSDKESNAIKVKPILTSNNLVLKAADAALNAVQDTMGIFAKTIITYI